MDEYTDRHFTVTVQRHWTPSGDPHSVRITHASPRVRISRQLIDGADPRYLVIDGDVLTIRDDYGQRFIYRIHWDDYADGGYLAEWPD